MKEYALLFPLIFVFHDMEELIGFSQFFANNREMLEKRFPQIAKTYRDFRTEGMALAVFEEFVICSLISIAVEFTNSEIFSYIWLGSFIGCTIHFCVHIVETCVIRKYIPAVITSIICLPFSIYIIWACKELIHNATAIQSVLLLSGIALVAVNLKFAHILMSWYSKKMNTSS